MDQQGRMRFRDHLEMKGVPEGLECGLIPFTEYFFSLHGFQAFSYYNGHGGPRLGR